MTLKVAGDRRRTPNLTQPVDSGSRSAATTSCAPQLLYREKYEYHMSVKYQILVNSINDTDL